MRGQGYFRNLSPAQFRVCLVLLPFLFFNCQKNATPDKDGNSTALPQAAKTDSLPVNALSSEDRAAFIKELRDSESILRLLAQDTGASAEKAGKLLDILEAEEKRTRKEVDSLLKKYGEEIVQNLGQTAKTFPETLELKEIRETREREEKAIREAIRKQERINRIRAEVIKTYKVNKDGVIELPGSFEGQFLYVPYFYERWKKGISETREFSGDSISGYAIVGVISRDQEVFPELQGIERIRIGWDADWYGNIHVIATPE